MPTRNLPARISSQLMIYFRAAGQIFTNGGKPKVIPNTKPQLQAKKSTSFNQA